MSYAGDVLWQAVDSMEPDDKPLIKRRLAFAAQYLMRLTRADFPEDLRPKFDAIIYDLSADPRHQGVGSFESTMDTMSDSTAARVVSAIRSLYTEMKGRGLGRAGDD